MTTISISGKETKKHINEALKAVFPGFKFSMTSEFDTVNVSWIDGPLASDVQKVLNRFKSYTRVLCKTDFEKATGYEWHGTTFVGARYLNTQRMVSGERKGLIDAYLIDTKGLSYADANIPERQEAERALIASGMLEGRPPADRSELMLEAAPVIDNRKKAADPAPVQANVIPLFSTRRMETLFEEACSPEQRLKLYILRNMEHLSNLEIKTPDQVDEAFTLLAAVLHQEGRV